MVARIGAIVQARMSSQRFPNKVLHEVAGKPMLQYLLERLEHCSCLDTIVVATSAEASDKAIVDHCKEHGIAFYQGPIHDVAGRFKEVLDRYQFSSFVRVNGDSPLLDQHLIEKAVDIFFKGNFEIVTNVLKRTYPKGQSVEVLRADTFRNGYELMGKNEHFEHVTTFFYDRPDNFRMQNFALAENLSEIHLSVDTRRDMNTFAAIISKMDRPHWQYGLEEILSIHQQVSYTAGREPGA